MTPTATRGALARRSAIFVALALAALACRGEPAAKASAADEARSAPSAAAAAPVPAKFPEEVFGDPKIYDQPRLQFTWTAPGEKRLSIWSMKVDGTDLRRAVAPEVLFSGDAKALNAIPVRSPDNRYIAFAGDDAEEEPLRAVVDLKTRTVRTMQRGFGVPYFNWSPDSRHVIFYGSVVLWDYDVEKGALTKLPMIYCSGLYLVDGGRKFLAIHEDSLEYFDRSGKKLERIPLPFKIQPNMHSLSADGSTLATYAGPDLVVIPVRHPEGAVRPDARREALAALGPAGRVVYLADYNVVRVLDTATGKMKEIQLPGDATAFGYSLFNVGARP